jgi:hypothetical protein
MINEENNSGFSQILSNPSQEQMAHKKFVEELDRKNGMTSWHWKMVALTFVIGGLWIVLSGKILGTDDGDPNPKKPEPPKISKPLK